MSKYEEICAAYAKARKTWEEHRQTCRDYVLQVLDRLVTDMEMPRDNLLLLPTNVSYDSSKAGPIEEMLCYGADGAFHTRLGFRVRLAADNPMTEVLLLRLSVLRNPAGFEFRFEGLNDPIRMPPEFDPQNKGYLSFLAYVMKRSISTYSDQDHRYSDQPDNPRSLSR